MKTYFLILAAVFTFACTTSSESEKSDLNPFVTVLNLQSAETLADYDEAKKYIDLDRVYGSVANDTLTPEKVWKDQVHFNFNLSKSGKFTNVFKYFNYDISQNIIGDKATIVFGAVRKSARLQKIVYELERTGFQWKVVAIEFHTVDN